MKGEKYINRICTSVNDNQQMTISTFLAHFGIKAQCRFEETKNTFSSGFAAKEGMEETLLLEIERCTKQ